MSRGLGDVYKRQVDDDSEIREILRILLCRNGFIVKEAADAKEALLKLDSSIDFFFC